MVKGIDCKSIGKPTVVRIYLTSLINFFNDSINYFSHIDFSQIFSREKDAFGVNYNVSKKIGEVYLFKDLIEFRKDIYFKFYRSEFFAEFLSKCSSFTIQILYYYKDGQIKPLCAYIVGINNSTDIAMYLKLYSISASDCGCDHLYNLSNLCITTEIEFNDFLVSTQHIHNGEYFYDNFIWLREAALVLSRAFGEASALFKK